MWGKVWKQAGTCLIIVLAFLLAKNSNVAVLERGAETALHYMSVSYTMQDMKAAAEKSGEVVAGITGKVSESVNVLTGKPVYTDPIDAEYAGNKTPIYAVGGGQVTAVGENEEIGKYVKITHADEAESLYGNLKSVHVSVPSNVKKGQIIGVYEKKKGKEFYYSFRELR